jgi:hypothetical protein
MTDPQDILRRRALEYHQRDDRGSSCGSMAIDMDLIFSGMVKIGSDSRLYVTEAGRAFLASGTPTRRAETTGSVGEADGGPTRRGTPNG